MAKRWQPEFPAQKIVPHNSEMVVSVKISIELFDLEIKLWWLLHAGHMPSDPVKQASQSGFQFSICTRINKNLGENSVKPYAIVDANVSSFG